MDTTIVANGADAVVTAQEIINAHLRKETPLEYGQRWLGASDRALGWFDRAFPNEFELHEEFEATRAEAERLLGGGPPQLGIEKLRSLCDRVSWWGETLKAEDALAKRDFLIGLLNPVVPAPKPRLTPEQKAAKEADRRARQLARSGSHGSLAVPRKGGKQKGNGKGKARKE